MQAIKCELCGSNSFTKEDGYFVCDHCNTKYTLEEAKKMMIEGTVNVKVDDSDELKNLYELARRAKSDNNSENAQKYYGQIVIKDPSNWEANFYTVYYQSMNCKIGEIGVAATRIISCEKTVFTLIKDNVNDADEQRKAVDEVASKLISISNMLFNAYKNYYDDINIQIKNKFVQAYASTCSLCREIVYEGGNNIVSIFGDQYGNIAARCWKLGVRQHNILNGVFDDKKGNASVINLYNEKIMKYDSSYEPPDTNMSQDGGCYVATAVYGSYDCPQVWTLRRYRDYNLAESWYGRAFVKTYYAISPTLVKWFGNTRLFKKLFKSKLDRMVKKLKSKGFKDTPYEDKKW